MSRNRMPVVFVGHGSPMNALADNAYAKSLRHLGESIPEPKAILLISAHWLTTDWAITAMVEPRTIHDFYGFPPELFAVRYPAPGSPELAQKIRSQFKLGDVFLDQDEWGLDHGSWSILKHLYPKANIPVMQFSVAIKKSISDQLAVGKALRWCREEGILLLGSGDVVHNLRQINRNANSAHKLAIEFDEWVKEKVLERNHLALANDYLLTEAGKWSVPTDDHYFPFLNLLEATDTNDPIQFPFEGIELGSISLRTICWG